MKKLHFLLPLLGYAVITLAYKALAMSVLEEIFGHDVTFYMDGREVYRFGMGSCSQLFMLVCFIAVMIWTWQTAGKFLKGKKKQLYQVLMGIGNTMIYVFWAGHFWQWYTVGFYYWWLYH